MADRGGPHGAPQSNIHEDREIMHLRGRLAESQQLNSQRSLVSADRDRAIAERDSLVLAWMHSNETFKRLTRQ